jgi:hypothetical protein
MLVRTKEDSYTRPIRLMTFIVLDHESVTSPAGIKILGCPLMTALPRGKGGQRLC